MNTNELDSNIVSLVEALNAFDGITTIGSCGGHPNPKPGQWDEGTWYIKFEVAHSEEGWFALEFVAWFVMDYIRAGHHIELYPKAPPPWWNTPGRCLSFALEGEFGEDPNAVARWLNTAREEHYISPADLAAEEEADEGAA